MGKCDICRLSFTIRQKKTQVRSSCGVCRNNASDGILCWGSDCFSDGQLLTGLKDMLSFHCPSTEAVLVFDEE